MIAAPLAVTSSRMTSTASAPLFIITQGHAGDRLGAALAPALRRHFPGRELVGLGGERMRGAGVRLLARTDTLSAMGVSGLLPKVPSILWTMRQAAARSREPLPGCVIAVDVWQPLRFLHRLGPHLRELPHVCYLPPGPNFIGRSRVHGAAAKAFRAIVTPFPHQARLFQEAGATVFPGAHAGLQTCREEARPLPVREREPIVAVLPGSRDLEVRYSLPVQLEAVRQIQARHPELEPVVCCADEAVARLVTRRFRGVRISRNARETMARARFGVICSGTAALEAAILGCPGVVTYHGSPLQRWEWNRFHVPGLARLRAEGIASPYIALPNILAGEELYPECLGVPPEAVAQAALGVLAQDPAVLRGRLDAVSSMLAWEDAGEVVARATQQALSA